VHVPWLTAFSCQRRTPRCRGNFNGKRSKGK
jgi:hypothetical protein